METVRDFIFLGSKITADGYWSHETKRCLLLGKKAFINLDNILNSKDITLPKNWCFWTYGACKKTLASPLDTKKTKPVNPKGNQPWISLEGLMLKLRLLIPWPPDVKSRLIGKTLIMEKIEGRRRGWQRMRWLAGITDSVDMSFCRLWGWWWTGRPGVLLFLGSQRVGHDWTELKEYREQYSRVGLQWY